jgi:hypothetical protein
VIDCVNYVVILGELEFFDIAARHQVVDGAAVALGIDSENTFAQHFDLGALQAIDGGMQLAVGVTDIDIVVIDQRDIADTAARAGLGRPGADAADTDDAEMRPLQRCQRGLAVNPGKARKSLPIFFAKHLTDYSFSGRSVLVYS